MKKFALPKFVKQKGFTLLETLIYIAILSVVIFSIVGYSLSLSGARNKNYSVQNVQANSRTALSIIGQKIRASSSVITPTYGTSSNQLVLDMPGASPNIIFSVSNGRLVMSEVGNPDVFITDNRIIVSNFVFTNMAASGEKDNINIQATISANVAIGDVENSYSQDLRTSVTRRN